MRFYPILLFALLAFVAIAINPLLSSAPAQEDASAKVIHSLSREDDGLVERVMPDGAIQVDLEGRFQSVSVATIAPDGTLQQRCLTSAEAMKTFLRSPEPTPTEHETR